MKCPTCDAWTFVRETRPAKDGGVRRRYECANEHRFTTLEQVTVVDAGVLKPGRRPRMPSEAQWLAALGPCGK